MRTPGAILTGLSFVGLALSSASAQNNGRLAEPPSPPRSAQGEPSAAPYSMGAYSGNGAQTQPQSGANPQGYAAPQTSANPPSANAIPQAQPVAPARTAPAADRTTSLRIGDQVMFKIMEDKDEAVSKRVLDTGELEIPYIGRVSAAGKTCDQVVSDIKRRLEADYYYKATIQLGLEQANVGRPVGRIYLSGLVRGPGPQDLFPGEKTTVSAAILKAGGFVQFADDRKVKVTRKGANGANESFTVDVKAILKDGRMELDREVREGDYIYVPKKFLNL